MNQTLKHKIFSFIKKPLIIAVLFFVFTLIEIYWAMGSFSDKPSSACLDCSFFDDAYLMTLFSTVFLSIVFLALSFIKNSTLKVILQLLILISVWFFWNYTIFVDRESSWSTYLFKEEIMYTLEFSFLPISILSLVTIFTLNYISRKL
ncbi:hypothetical protein [Flavobacterium humidisoli]|uniref:Vitamin K epoxide reductase family protein n=1 Tax=Flavobacterium humidisoli TaxID=2937442 RepID=A0ABY4LUZ8_9FLAO|nr:hypothetical protein [Flavobacterium humidisoli]UPZ16383.1 hypothetical protein M0M44_03355 [Flavobacterium humidisoli]